MDEKMVTVPYADFVDGMQALATLNLIRAMIVDGNEYCSSPVMAVLGLEVKKSAGTDRKSDGC